MSDVREVQLPGVGVRLEFTTELGENVGVIVHRGGRRELLVYDDADPDRCSTALHLSVEDSHTLTEMLGGSRVSEVASTVQSDIEGLAIDWLSVTEGSQLVGKSIGEADLRSQTGVSLVAVLRDGTTIAAPGAEFVIRSGDVAVAVGTPPGIEDVRSALQT